MIDEQTVWNDIWPVVEGVIRATLAEDEAAVKERLVPGSQAAVLHNLFGATVFDILLKTVLGRNQLGLTRAIETENGRAVHVEYAWPEATAANRQYTAADVVTVRLRRYRQAWRVEEINPASADLPLGEARAQGILLANRAGGEGEPPPAEPWVLPVALFAGALQLPLRPQATRDAVERLLLPGLQQRGYGVLSLVAGRRLWRDFKRKARPTLERPAAWAAAAEFIMNEQSLRQQTQAAVAQQYQAGLTATLPRIRQMKETLAIQGLDERYTPLHTTQIVVQDGQE
ncbi:MAG: hypothetical protein L0332_32310 [Chloroflexi bacterium]|nr:hypothetical protein [Chloroflexota bacterium]MCI0731387.1 hypothetical protein [Chloroflexota bacterium]